MRPSSLAKLREEEVPTRPSQRGVAAAAGFRVRGAMSATAAPHPNPERRPDEPAAVAPVIRPGDAPSAQARRAPSPLEMGRRGDAGGPHRWREEATVGPARPDGRRPARAGWAALGCAALATVAVLLALGPMATNRPTISAVDPGATDAGSLARLRTLNGHVGTVMDLAFSADGALLASIGSDGAVLLWDAARGGLAWALPTADPTASRPLAARRAAFAPDGGALAVGYADGGVRLWDVATGDALRLLDHDAAVESLAFSPSGRVLAVGTGDGRVRWWDPASGRGLRTLVGHQSPVRAVAFAPDGRSMASADWAGTVRLWDVASGRSTHGATVGTLVTALAFSPDGTTLAAGGWGGVGLWDTARGIEVGHLGQAPGTQQVVFSPDGLELAALGGDGTLLRWDIARGRVERRWRSVDAPSIGALSSDGQLVALAPIAASNAEIGVWAAR